MKTDHRGDAWFVGWEWLVGLFGLLLVVLVWFLVVPQYERWRAGIWAQEMQKHQVLPAAGGPK